jgi:hypothetical protein
MSKFLWGKLLFGIFELVLKRGNNNNYNAANAVGWWEKNSSVASSAGGSLHSVPLRVANPGKDPCARSGQLFLPPIFGMFLTREMEITMCSFSPEGQSDIGATGKLWASRRVDLRYEVLSSEIFLLSVGVIRPFMGHNWQQGNRS